MAGSNLTYTLTVTNAGPSPASDRGSVPETVPGNHGEAPRRRVDHPRGPCTVCPDRPTGANLPEVVRPHERAPDPALGGSPDHELECLLRQAANALLPLHLGTWARERGDEVSYVSYPPRSGGTTPLPGPVAWMPAPHSRILWSMR